jgi:hypothetical protein
VVATFMPMIEPGPPAPGLNRAIGQCCSALMSRNIVNSQRDQSRARMSLATDWREFEEASGMAHTMDGKSQSADWPEQFSIYILQFSICNYLPLSEVLHVVKQDLFAFLKSHFNLVGRPGEFDRA